VLQVDGDLGGRHNSDQQRPTPAVEEYERGKRQASWWKERDAGGGSAKEPERELGSERVQAADDEGES
jgi:hypothetical protein